MASRPLGSGVLSLIILDSKILECHKYLRVLLLLLVHSSRSEQGRPGPAGSILVLQTEN
jgi:hypothetical protein